MSQQRQRHGVTKNLVEGIGGVVVGIALVLFARSYQRHKQQPRKPAVAPAHQEPNA